MNNDMINVVGFTYELERYCDWWYVIWNDFVNYDMIIIVWNVYDSEWDCGW